MSTISALIPRLQRKAVGVPTTMAELELRDSVRRFCAVTQIWRQTFSILPGRARGRIQLVGNPSSGDYITLDDGTNTATTLTFGTNVTIGASAVATMANLVTAINAASSLAITATATSPASEICNLANDSADDAGNVNIEYSGANIYVEGMSTSFVPLTTTGLVAASTAAPKVASIAGVNLSGNVICPDYYRFRYDDQVMIFDTDLTASGGADDLQILGILEPAPTASDYPDWLVSYRYIDAIIGGALYELLRTPGRPYSNPNAAMMYKRDFDRGIGIARMDIDNGFVSRVGSTTLTSGNYNGLQG